MSLFVRKARSTSDKYGDIVYYVDNDRFVRKSSSSSDIHGEIVYYFDNNGFVRRARSVSDKFGEIVYFIDDNGFVRRARSVSDKFGEIVYFIDDKGFVRKSRSVNDRFGEIVYYYQKSINNTTPQPSIDEKKGMLLLIAFIVGLFLAPILIVLAMYNKIPKFKLFENVQPIKAFKKFRKTYSIINFSWLGAGILAITLFSIFGLSGGTIISLYSMVGGNIILLILSIVIGNKIYNEHKDELPSAVEMTDSQEQNDGYKEIDDDGYSEDEVNQESANIPGVPDSQLAKELYSYRQMYDNGLITEEEYNSLKANLFRAIGVKPNDKPKNKVGLLWFFNIFNFTGIFTSVKYHIQFLPAIFISVTAKNTANAWATCAK